MKRMARWNDLKRLLEHLEAAGHIPCGPRLKDGAIVVDEIGSLDDLPFGWTDTQEPGGYSLRRHPEPLVLLGWHPGPESWKRLFLPPRITIWEGRRTESGFEISAGPRDSSLMACIGMRACDVAGLARLDTIFGFQQPSTGWAPEYCTRRRRTFIVGIQCIQAGANCFCSSVGSGPHIASGCDLVLTELPGGVETLFLLESLTPAGAEVLEVLSLPAARDEEIERAASLVDACRSSMAKFIDLSGIRELLDRQWECRRWDETAERCLTCGNCTLVCPTCFCSNILDETELDGLTARRIQVWDSCFTLEFTYVHGGGNVRTSAKSRYRHWMTHKLATWLDQFGALGCVGCGRCITWCPAGIDITEEAAALRRLDGVGTPSAEEKCYVRS